MIYGTAIDRPFSDAQFLAMDMSERETIYRQANLEMRLDLVARLNGLGMKEEVQAISPSLVSPRMDIVTKRGRILDFFRGIHAESRLLREPPGEGWMNKKTMICRVYCQQHLQRTISKLGLKYIKTPQKVVVIEGDRFTAKGYVSCGVGMGRYNLYSDDAVVYAREIKAVDRKITRIEVDEFIAMIADSNFTDLNVENFILATDGIYAIDTELKSFDGPIRWGKVGRFEEWIAPEDLDYFQSEVTKRMEGSKESNRPIIKAFKRDQWEMLEFLMDGGIEVDQALVTSFRRVGADIRENWHLDPLQFTFSMEEIL